MIEARHISKHYRGQAVLNDVCLEVSPGRSLILGGDNGSGKTTLLHIMMGLRAPDAGRVLWNDQELNSRRAWRRARHKIITFFYARCPLDQFCPAQSRRLAQLQSRLGAAGGEVHLVSLTLNAEHDNTEVLAAYADGYNVDPARWTLAGSDDPASIRDFAERVGGRIRVDEKHAQIDHALVAVRVDGDRIVDYAYGLDNIEKLILGVRPSTSP